MIKFKNPADKKFVTDSTVPRRILEDILGDDKRWLYLLKMTPNMTKKDQEKVKSLLFTEILPESMQVWLGKLNNIFRDPERPDIKGMTREEQVEYEDKNDSALAKKTAI